MSKRLEMLQISAQQSPFGVNGLAGTQGRDY